MNTKHTPGPWAIESCGDKGDGSYMIGVVFGPDDIDATTPLSGFLPKSEEDGEYIEYYRDELVAEVEHRSPNAYANACLIGTAPALLQIARWAVEYDGGECFGDHPKRLAFARAAIAKAEGRNTKDARASTERGEANTSIPGDHT